VGWIANCDPGFPGYAGEIAKNVPTLAEILRENGYATMMVGKWHNTFQSNQGPSGPFDSWPTQRGFDRFVGILEGETHSFAPHHLYTGNNVVDTETYPKDFMTTDFFTDQAIKMIKETRAALIQRPYLLYLAYNAVHAPLCAKPDDLAKYKGHYDAGWNQLREERYQRQVRMGLLPKGTRLADFNPGIPRWDDLSEKDKKFYSRLMEVYAAYADNLDQNFGKLHNYLKESGQLDNTISIFTSDNGASAEGGVEGMSNSVREFALLPPDHDFDVSRTDILGTLQTWTHYPIGWSTVSNTPFKLYKRDTFAGGRRIPFIISWSKKLSDRGGIRSQFAHMTAVVPTLLEVTGITHPESFNGMKTKPVEGTSFSYAFSDPAAPERHAEQYFENEGNRAYYKDGWVIVTHHATKTPFVDSEWELYNMKEDFSEATNLAAKYPEKVKELAAAFEQAAWKYQVYPLDDRKFERMFATPPQYNVIPEAKTFYPGTPTIFRDDIASILIDRSYTSTAVLNYTPGDRGVIYAHGGQDAGYILYIENGELAYEYNSFGKMIKLPKAKIEPGRLEIVLDVKAIGKFMGEASLSVNGRKVSEGMVGPLLVAVAHEGLDIGLDRRAPVSYDIYAKHGAFPYTGKIESVTYVPGPYAPGSPFQSQ
jgi:arylsulfatase